MVGRVLTIWYEQSTWIQLSFTLLQPIACFMVIFYQGFWASRHWDCGSITSTWTSRKHDHKSRKSTGTSLELSTAQIFQHWLTSLISSSSFQLVWILQTGTSCDTRSCAFQVKCLWHKSIFPQERMYWSRKQHHNAGLETGFRDFGCSTAFLKLFFLLQYLIGTEKRGLRV